MMQQGKFYGWKLLVVLWSILLTNLAFPLYGGGVINAYMAGELHFSRSTLGTAFAIFQWMIGLPGPLVAMCVNQKGVRFTLRVGAFVALGGALLMVMLVQTSWQFEVVFGFVIGAGVITAGPLPAQSGIVRWFDRRRALAISLLLTGPAVGGFVAPLVLDRLIAHYRGDWRAGWWMIAGLNVTGILLASLFVKENPSDVGQFPDGESGPVTGFRDALSQEKRGVYRTSGEWTFAAVLQSPAWWLMLLACLGFSAGYTIFLAHGVVHLKDLGHTPAEAAFSYSVMLFASLLGNLLVAALGDRIEPRFLWAAASCAYGVGMLLVLKATGPAGLYAYAVFLGIGFGMAYPTMMTLPGNYYGAKIYPLVVSVLLAVATTAGAVGAVWAGYAYDHLGTYSRVFSGVAILCFLGTILSFFMTPPARKVGIPADE